jgi:hypothetical protein
VLVATGTSVVLPPALVAEMAAAFASLPHISFVWCLKEVRWPHACVRACALVCVCGLIM